MFISFGTKAGSIATKQPEKTKTLGNAIRSGRIKVDSWFVKSLICWFEILGFTPPDASWLRGGIFCPRNHFSLSSSPFNSAPFTFHPTLFHPSPYIFYPSFFTIHPSLFSLHPCSIEYYENFCRLQLVNHQLIKLFIIKIMLTTIIFTHYRKVSNIILNCRILDCYIAFPQSITRNFIILHFHPPRQLKVLIPHGYGKKITFWLFYNFPVFTYFI